MEKYKAVYKCRLCGEVYQTGATTDKEIAERCMACMTAGIRGVVPGAPREHETHHCGGPYTGSLGLADFQGWEATP